MYAQVHNAVDGKLKLDGKAIKVAATITIARGVPLAGKVPKPPRSRLISFTDHLAAKKFGKLFGGDSTLSFIFGFSFSSFTTDLLYEPIHKIRRE